MVDETSQGYPADPLVCRYCGAPGGHDCEAPVPMETTADSPEYRRRHGPCSRWCCKSCGKRLLRRWKSLIEEGIRKWEVWRAEAGGHAYFFTQTIPHRGQTWRFENETAHKEFTRLFQQLREEFARIYGVEVVAYVGACEPHEDGYLHGHVAIWTTGELHRCTPAGLGGVNRWRKAKGLRPLRRDADTGCYCSEADPCVQRLARRLGFGINKLQPLHAREGVGALVGYVTKSLAGYLTKQVGLLEWPTYARRVRHSRDFAEVTMADLRERARAEAIARLQAEGKWTPGLQWRRAFTWGEFVQTEDGDLMTYPETFELVPAHAFEERLPAGGGGPPPQVVSPLTGEPLPVPF